MTSVFRFGVRLGDAAKVILSRNPRENFTRCISGKALRCQRPPVSKPAPWPYLKKRFNLFHYLYDSTSARMDENSKIVVVDGPIAAGKSKLAQELADELDMLYLPEANLDMLYINDRGYDLRQLDELIPESCRTFDVNDFMQNPKHFLAACFQIRQYIVKYSQYIDALAHLFSTGQGVVLDRCVYSDFVFAEAMFSQGFLSKKAHNAYYDIRKNTINELMQPHLIVYLDVPPAKILERVAKRCIPYEKNSKVLTLEYLTALENAYKQKFLKQIGQNAQLLVYDWSEVGEVEIVVEDIERLSFERENPYDSKFKDWVFPLEETWAEARYQYTDNKEKMMHMFGSIPRYDVPELVITAEDFNKYRAVVFEAPGEYYQKGYDPVMDGSTLFKVGLNTRERLPIRERRVPLN